MLIEFFINTILNIVSFIFNNIIYVLFPNLTIPSKFAESLTVIISTTSQANNFVHFMLGDTAYILLPLVLLLIAYKYLVYPIASTVIGIFVSKA